MFRYPLAVLFIILLLLNGCLTQGGLTQPLESPETVPTTISDAPPLTERPALVEAGEAAQTSSRGLPGYASHLSERHAACLQCHGDVKPFHTAEVIYLLDIEKGLNPRLCIVCHGRKVHDIHWEILQKEVIKCDTCHLIGGEFVRPSAREGQLLVCELCHSGGNYIKIHIEGVILEGAPIDPIWIKEGMKHQCDTCHVGDFEIIHFEPLGSWKKRISRLMAKSAANPASPLNISYN